MTRLSWEDGPVFSFTADIDWASEPVISYSHKLVADDAFKITYFNTHPSDTLLSLRTDDKIDLLVHPNFLPDSSHGNSFHDVMGYCEKLVPDADGFRTHRYFEVNDIMDEYAKRGMKFFSNHCTRCEVGLTALHHRSGMISLPIFLEDGGFLLMDPELDFSALLPRLKTPGLKIINFHPAHMAFNTPRFSYTREIKDKLSREQWNNIDEKMLKTLSYSGTGIADVIRRIADFAGDNQFPIKTMRELDREFRNSRGL
jgi:hypothetical protein